MSVVAHTNSKLIRDTGNCGLVTRLSINIGDAITPAGRIKSRILLKALFLDSSKLSPEYWNNFVTANYLIEEHKAQMAPSVIKVFA